MKRVILFVLFAVLISLLSGCATIYHKPEFSGRLIDAETKEPLEGAVAVVLYYKQATVSLNVGGVSDYPFAARETLTDSKGEFYFPSYTSILILSEGTQVGFIFYKPGYMAHSGIINTGIGGARITGERYFATDVVGKEVEIEVWSQRLGRQVKWRGPVGIVEMKKGERDPLTPTDYRSDKLPLLFKAMNEDRRNRGYKGELK